MKNIVSGDDSFCASPKVLLHLKKSGYRIVKCENFFANSATKCAYFVITLNDNSKKFVKVGENVGREIKNLP